MRLPALASDDQVRGRLERLALLGAKSAEVAHELRNALSVLETSLHLVRRALKNTPDVEGRVDGHLGRMAQQIHAGQAIVREVLDEARDQGVERTHVDLRTLVMEVVAGIPRPDDVELQVDVVPKRVSVDARQMRQLVLNLVRNAIEALDSLPQDEERLVRVRSEVVDEVLHLSVDDSGPGIDASIVPRLFQAFASGKSGGTGLGLAVCRRIAQAHGGDIAARNLKPRGTSFEVTLPLL